jgi:predicted ATPase/DNA-binding SARP family transcriptional activator
VADVEFGLLGPVEVRVSGQVLRLGGMRPRVVLAVLLLAGCPVSEQRLIDAVWGGAVPVSARSSLRSHVSRLRTALGSTVGPRLRHEHGGYQLLLRPAELDVHRVQALAGRARAVRPSDPAIAARLFAEALACWRGPALAEFANLPGFEASGLSADRVRLCGLRRALREEWLDARLESGEHAELLPDLEAATADEPLGERAHRLLATALYRCGRATDALATLRRYRARLADETGLDPTDGLAALEAAVLARDPGLDPVPPQVPTSVAAPGVARTVLLGPPANPFFGREVEREVLARAVRTERLVTVTGPGGVGKTRLVLESLRGLAADEVILLDLAPLGHGADVLPALATQLGVRPSATTALDDAVMQALWERRLLLVVDNCEHVGPAVADMVTSILRHARDVTVLATSRQRLGLPEEQVVPLGPLPVPMTAAEEPTGDEREPTSVLLFADRARRVRPSFALTPANSALVGRICRRLDGMPLALELAASMVAALDLQTLAATLDSQLDLPGRPGTERHRSLRAVVDSSFELLTDDERRLFDDLSIFPDWFDLAAAKAVAEAESGAALIGGLVRLVDASLVLVTELEDGRLRYRMLETLRQYGRERLTRSGRSDTTAQRFVAWAVRFAVLAERGLYGPNEAAWVRRVGIEFGNLRSAWQQAVAADDLAAGARIAVALADHARLRSLPEPWSWAISIARRGELPRAAWVVGVLGAAAQASCLLGDPDAAEGFIRGGLARATGSASGRWRCLHARATALMIRGDHEAAAKSSRKAAAEPDCPPVLRANFEANAGLARSYAGISTAADIDGPTGALRRGDWPSGRAWGWYVAAEAVRLDDPAESIHRLKQAIDLARPVGSVFIQGLAEVGIAAAALRIGDRVTAIRLLPDIVRGWQQSGSWFQQWTTLRTLAALLSELDADDHAAVLLGAVDAASDAPAIGAAEAAAYTARRRKLEIRLGTSRFAEMTARGAAQPRTAIVDYALHAIESVGQGRTSAE